MTELDKFAAEYREEVENTYTVQSEIGFATWKQQDDGIYIVEIYTNPDQRKMIFCVNQLGGIGAPSKMFAPTADGSCASCSKEAKAHNFVILAYRQLLCRPVDENGLSKYTKQILNDPRGLCIGIEQVAIDLINSPEGKSCMRSLGIVEAQKHIHIVSDYVRGACN